MIVIRHASMVQRPAVDIWRFLVAMDVASYRTWHPNDHHNFERLRNPSDNSGKGQVVRFTESVGGRYLRFKCIISESEKGCYVEFKPCGLVACLKPGRGYFLIDEKGDAGTRFEAVLELGWRGVGSILDHVLMRYLNIEALRVHIEEEGYFINTALADDH